MKYWKGNFSRDISPLRKSDFLSQKRSKLAGLQDPKKIIATWTLFDPN